MKNSKLLFIVLLFTIGVLVVCFKPLWILILFTVLLLIISVFFIAYLIICIVEFSKDSFIALPENRNIFSIMCNWANSFPQIIKKKDAK